MQVFGLRYEVFTRLTILFMSARLKSKKESANALSTLMRSSSMLALMRKILSIKTPQVVQDPETIAAPKIVTIEDTPTPKSAR